VLKKTLDPRAEETALPAFPDIVVMGNTGRKGPKNQRTTLGSTIDQALRHLKYPCLVIKEVLPAGPKTYMMAVDVKDVSKRGLDILLTIVNAKDTLLLVHFLPEGEHFNEEKIDMKEYYESELEHSGPAIHSFTFVTRAGEVPLTHAISSYVNEANPHVFAIAPRAVREWGSITDYIVNHVSPSVLLCKA